MAPSSTTRRTSATSSSSLESGSAGSAQRARKTESGVVRRARDQVQPEVLGEERRVVQYARRWTSARQSVRAARRRPKKRRERRMYQFDRSSRCASYSSSTRPAKGLVLRRLAHEQRVRATPAVERRPIARPRPRSPYDVEPRCSRSRRRTRGSRRRGQLALDLVRRPVAEGGFRSGGCAELPAHGVGAHAVERVRRLDRVPHDRASRGRARPASSRSRAPA